MTPLANAQAGSHSVQLVRCGKPPPILSFHGLIVYEEWWQTLRNRIARRRFKKADTFKG